MVEAFVGLVGGGKSYSSVRRMLNYIASGGVCVSNILLTGYDVDSKSFDPASPVLSYLADVLHWSYQPGQYQFISFDDMATMPGWFTRVPGGQSRTKRTLLCIDEATDLFDSLDRGKLNNDSVYRELFRFLRLSRHAHIDVLFICQDLNSINIRLRGLVGCIWRSTDLSTFRIGGSLRIALPINCFLLQQFDRTGKLELRREFVSKDSRIFDLYQSEAFHDDLGITFSGPVSDGHIRSKKKMNKLERIALFSSLVLVFFLLYSQCQIRRDFDRRFDELFAKNQSQDIDSDSSVKNSPEVEKSSFLSSKSKGFSLFPRKSNEDEFDVKNTQDKPSRVILRGVFNFTETPNEKYCFVDGSLYKVGMLTEYGLCKVVSKNSIICVDGLVETVILPRAESREASAVSLQGVLPGDAPL